MARQDLGLARQGVLNPLEPTGVGSQHVIHRGEPLVDGVEPRIVAVEGGASGPDVLVDERQPVRYGVDSGGQHVLDLLLKVSYPGFEGLILRDHSVTLTRPTVIFGPDLLAH